MTAYDIIIVHTSFDKSMIYQALLWLSVYHGTENFSNSLCSISACCPNEESSGADDEERDQCSLHW